MFVFRFALKNVLSRKSSIVIILFIGFCISIFLLSNAIFDGTDNGMENTFVNSFTADFVIRSKTDFPLSLFGDETPLTGELSTIPELVPYAQVLETVENTDNIEKITPQFTGNAMLNVNDESVGVLSLFGVDALQYLPMMSSIKILQGVPYNNGEKGIMLNEWTVAQIEHEAKVKITVGDRVQLVMPQGISATVRSVPVTAIYTYAVENAMLKKIALIDPKTVRELMGTNDATLDTNIEESKRNLLENDLFDDIDSIFDTAEDSVTSEVQLDSMTETVDIQEEDISNAESTVWSYILCKTKDRKSTKRAISRLNYIFHANNWPVQAVKWRNAAGGTVNMVYYLRAISNIGILLVLIIGFVVVNNTLIISALGRICETGTLRAIGAKRSFIRLQFLYETLILTMTAGVVGCLLGLAFNISLTRAHIYIANSYLQQLFGGTVLSSTITLHNVINCMGLCVILAIAGWYYPMRIAIQTSPVEAMRGQT